jgi:hypothetical protein
MREIATRLVPAYMAENHPYRDITSKGKIDKIMHYPRLAAESRQSVSILIFSALPYPAPASAPSHVLFNLISNSIALCDSKFCLHSYLERQL